jgi:multiple sugar transport system permease protein
MVTLERTEPGSRHPSRAGASALARARSLMAHRREVAVGYLFVLPVICLFVVFQFGPTLAAFAISFTTYEVGGTPVLDGIGNYVDMVRDPVFWTSVRVTATYTAIAVPVTTCLALALASLLTSGIRWVGAYRGVFFLPYVTSTVMAAIVWLYIFDPTNKGLLNMTLGAVHLGPVAWLQQPALVLPALAAMASWKGFGYSMLIFVAGLLSIPHVYHEAARVDGAGWWGRFRNVTLPLLRPIFFFVLVIETIGSFQVFDAVYVMTSGGPARSSYTLVYMLYNQGFEYFNYGYACAVGVFLFVAVFVLSMVQRRLLGGDA